MKEYVLILPVILFFILLNGCETWRDDCGNIIVKNELDDLTMKVVENYYRDLFAEPVVLEHSKHKAIQIIVEGGGVIADAYRSHSNTTGQLNALEIDAKNKVQQR